jgi:methionyl-tRNA formyltransferase
MLDGARLRLYESTLSEERAGAAPGTILSLDDGMKLAAADGAITVRRVRLEPDTKKVPPAELAAARRIAPGTRFL